MLLPCAPASVALARRQISHDLRAAGVFGAAVEDAALVVSELLSNAIRHARPLPGSQLQVTWVLAGGSVELAVSDGGGPTRPYAGYPSLSALGGRGMGIVAHLALRWGTRDDNQGLTVWAILAAPPSFDRDAVASTP